ncbi:MAG: hypothetical protein LGR52_07625 [Candidatus Thiosymbion ectosymbiont of Robbea hypermnestra]|nr:hypothetical protein [Candidatus Thiosymbion ectosymbiont of Robbea hypermnestra]
MNSKPRRTRQEREAVSAKAGASEKGTGFADVIIRLIDALYDLAQTGNLIGLIIFGFVCWVFYVTYKLPPESLDGMLGGIGGFLISEKFCFLPLASVLIASLIANVVQAKVYKSHIHDLAEHRKFLVHGMETGALKPLMIHRSSGFDIRSDSMTNGREEENAGR